MRVFFSVLCTRMLYLQDGLLSKHEFMTILEGAWHRPVSEDEADLLFELYDHDHDGFLTYEELVNAVGDFPTAHHR